MVTMTVAMVTKRAMGTATRWWATKRAMATAARAMTTVLECLIAAWKALSHANAKGTGINDWVIRSLDD